MSDPADVEARHNAYRAGLCIDCRTRPAQRRQTTMRNLPPPVGKPMEHTMTSAHNNPTPTLHTPEEH